MCEHVDEVGLPKANKRSLSSGEISRVIARRVSSSISDVSYWIQTVSNKIPFLFRFKSNFNRIFLKRLKD